jgi:hypothetical protein
MAVNVVQSALSSRRFNRWLLVIATIVLVAGVIAIVVTQFGNTAPKTENPNPTGPPIALPKDQPNIRFPAAAWKVAQTFIYSAVSRQNLAASYKLADPNVRAGFTLDEWKSGNIQVPYFPTSKIIRYNWKNGNYAHPRAVGQNIWLAPAKGSGQSLTPFWIELVKVGKGAKAHWVVDYFGALRGPPVPHE